MRRALEKSVLGEGINWRPDGRFVQARGLHPYNHQHAPDPSRRNKNLLMEEEKHRVGNDTKKGLQHNLEVRSAAPVRPRMSWWATVTRYTPRGGQGGGEPQRPSAGAADEPSLGCLGGRCAGKSGHKVGR
jgi:hypothetical protein